MRLLALAWKRRGSIHCEYGEAERETAGAEEDKFRPGRAYNHRSVGSEEETQDMESNGNDNIAPTSMCKNGCGFYGNSQFENMCSKCYKDVVKRKNASPVGGRLSPIATSTAVSETTAEKVDSMTVSLAQANLDEPTLTPSSADLETASPTVMMAASSSQDKDSDFGQEGAEGGVDIDDASSDSSGDKDKKPKKNRCHTCRKKVGLTGFQCRCGGLYCGIHRYSDKHQCSFDYKEHGMEQIRKNNPIIVGSKVAKI